MSYAVRNDGQGFRSVESKKDCTSDEYWSAEPIFIGVTRQDVERQRLSAYADPLTGSDRYFSEANRLEAMGQSIESIEAARKAGADRYTEIQAQHPWPEVE